MAHAEVKRPNPATCSEANPDLQKRGQHFLLSPEAKTLSTKKVARMSESEARETFEKLRWSDTNGEPVCPCCGSIGAYTINFTRSGKSKQRYKCKSKGCYKQFTVTTGTIFAHHKLELRDYLLAIAFYVNSPKGKSAVTLQDDIDVSYKTSFVLLHKIRHTLIGFNDDTMLSGVVEMDACYTGNYTRPENKKEDRKDRRLSQNQNPNKRAVSVVRQRASKEDIENSLKGAVATKVFVTKGEYSDVINKIAKDHIVRGSTIHTDGASGYKDLAAWFDSIEGDHSVAYKADNGACSNQAESFFSRFRKMEFGVHHHMSNLYLYNYANEIAYREDTRRWDSGRKFRDITSRAMNTSNNCEWVGYWQGNRPACEKLVA